MKVGRSELLCLILFPIWLQNHIDISSIKMRWGSSLVKEQMQWSSSEMQAIESDRFLWYKISQTIFQGQRKASMSFCSYALTLIINFDSWSFLCKHENAWLEFWLMQFWWHFPTTEGRFDELTIYLYQQSFCRPWTGGLCKNAATLQILLPKDHNHCKVLQENVIYYQGQCPPTPPFPCNFKQ